LANTRSARKRIRQIEKRRIRNRVHRTRARTEVKQARAAMASGDMDTSREAVREAASYLDHAATKGAIHKRNAARRKSRLMKRLAVMEKEAAAAQAAAAQAAAAAAAEGEPEPKPKRTRRSTKKTAEASE
jgi:small subunit ribosomal protein S20